MIFSLYFGFSVSQLRMMVKFSQWHCYVNEGSIEFKVSFIFYFPRKTRRMSYKEVRATIRCPLTTSSIMAVQVMPLKPFSNLPLLFIYITEMVWVVLSRGFQWNMNTGVRNSASASLSFYFYFNLICKKKPTCLSSKFYLFLRRWLSLQ